MYLFPIRMLIQINSLGSCLFFYRRLEMRISSSAYFKLSRSGLADSLTSLGCHTPVQMTVYGHTACLLIQMTCYNLSMSPRLNQSQDYSKFRSSMTFSLTKSPVNRQTDPDLIIIFTQLTNNKLYSSVHYYILDKKY